MSPTFEAGGRAQREYVRLTREQRRAFDAARRRLVAGLRGSPPRFDPALRVKRVQGRPGVWELSWAADGRATFSYGPEVLPGETHIVWRRIGDHSILVDPKPRTPPCRPIPAMSQPHEHGKNAVRGV